MSDAPDPAAPGPQESTAPASGTAAPISHAPAGVPDPAVETSTATTGSTSTTESAEAAPKKKKQGSFLKELPVLVVIAVGLALLIRAFFIQAFFIPSGSMETTLLVGDRVLVNKLVYRFRDVHRGEVVVFNGLDSFTPDVGTRVAVPAKGLQKVRQALASAIGFAPPDEKDYIKRVIGLPGDVVACCDDGKVTVNGEPIDEPYIFENDPVEQRSFEAVTVEQGRVWVMGDHRSSSSDSRVNGTVPIDRIIGRAFVVIWPPGNSKVLRVPKSLEGHDQALGLPHAPPALAAAPGVLGLLGAVPLTVAQRSLRRRLRERRTAQV